MEIEQKETDCKCDNSTGWTTIKCCNQCGKSIEPFWRVDNKTQTEKDETGRDIIGIEEKEMERIENYYNGSLMDEEHRDYAKLGARTEHLHFQKEVIQPLRKQYNDLGVKFDKEVERWQERDEKERSIRFKLEAENKALREAATRYRDGELVERSTIIKSLFESGDPMRELSVGQFMDYIKEFTPPTNQTECERCKGTGLVGMTIHTENGDFDADDQPCPDCKPLKP